MLHFTLPSAVLECYMCIDRYGEAKICILRYLVAKITQLQRVRSKGSIVKHYFCPYICSMKYPTKLLS
jgi:hypothetical protein